MKSVSLVALAIFFTLLSPMIVDAQKSLKSYSVEDEFSFQYPSNWKLHERENRFSDTDAWLTYSNNGKDVLKIILQGYSNTTAQPDDEKLEALESTVKNQENGEIVESGVDNQMTNNRSAPYVIGTFTDRTLFGTPLNMVMLLSAVLLPNNELIVVEYYASENDFDKYLPKVKGVINSISPISPV
ncbi:MAG: hypothetical protein WBL64_05365 [Nitrososphaeraceae archaeon]